MNDKITLQRADMHGWSLSQWLDYLESIHSKDIDMGLSRVQQVFDRLNCDFSSTRVITVAGTNGKGTTCAMLEQLCLADGLSTVVYGSPHLVSYCERVRVNGEMLDQQAHCDAFMAVETARADTSLTYFEFGTLAALWLAAQSDSEITLLEVGLGGRLDAVNVVDPNIAVITSIDLDHQDWLGDTREAIGAEKAGVFRAGIPVVVGDMDPPDSVIQHARKLNTQASYQTQDFSIQPKGQGFEWSSNTRIVAELPAPHIPAQNLSTALRVSELLDLDLTDQQIRDVISKTKLPGRAQIIDHQPSVMLDVAHNPHATEYLAQVVGNQQYQQLHIVVSMLADKDIENALQPLMRLPANWYIGKLDVPRAAEIEQIKTVLVGQRKVLDFASVWQAYQAAHSAANSGDLIVVMGSFFTVAEVLSQLQQQKGEG